MAVSAWRSKLRNRLAAAASVGQRIPVEALFVEVCDDIPLHTASRVGKRYGNGELGAMGMRFVTFRLYLHAFEVAFDPPVGYSGKNKLTMATKVLGKLRPCAQCGTPYFGLSAATHCSMSCASVGVREKQRQERAAKGGETPKPPAPPQAPADGAPA